MVAPDTVPDKTADALFLQAMISKPALTTGDGVYVIFTLSTTCKQEPLLVDVNVRETTPAAKSAALGI